MSTDQAAHQEPRELNPEQEQIIVPPSVEDTEKDIKSIDEVAKDRSERAINALKTLARNVITAVENADQSTSVSRYLTELRIIVEAEGVYRLELYDRDAGINPQMIAQEIANEVSAGDFGKRLRPIQLELNTNIPAPQ